MHFLVFTSLSIALWSMLSSRFIRSLFSSRSIALCLIHTLPFVVLFDISSLPFGNDKNPAQLNAIYAAFIVATDYSRSNQRRHLLVILQKQQQQQQHQQRLIGIVVHIKFQIAVHTLCHISSLINRNNSVDFKFMKFP